MGDAEAIDRETARSLWAHVLERGLLDLRNGSGHDLEDAAAWFAAGVTLQLAADALDLEPELLQAAGRRVLVQRFGAREAGRLLGQRLVQARRRIGRRRTHDRVVRTTAGALAR